MRDTEQEDDTVRKLLCACAIAWLAACSPKPAEQAKPAAAPVASSPATTVSTPAPSGDYTLDKAHASLTFQVNHMGFSHYTARFKSFDAKLKLDPANPSASTINVTIDPRSLDVNAPPAGFLNSLLGTQWLDAARYPRITFTSTRVGLIGPDTAKVTGDLTLHGVTKPVTLDVKFNGGYRGFAMDPHARVGFSAHGAFKRSDFGIAYGIPAAGTTMGVSDDVDVQIETEFNGPALQTSAPDAVKTP